MAKKKEKTTKKRKKATKKPSVQKYRGFSRKSLYNRVKRVVWAEHKAEFKNYIEFISNRKDEDGQPIPKSSLPVLIMSEIRRIEHFNDADILRIYDYHQAEDNEAESTISEQILPYWEVGFKDSHRAVSRLREYFDGITPNITIIAPKIINKHAQFNAASYVDDDYFTHFQQWVLWCNAYAEANDLASDVTIHFTFSEPYQAQNRDMRWEVELFPCSPNGSADGLPDNYDYEPEIPDENLMHTIKVFPETGEIIEEGEAPIIVDEETKQVPFDNSLLIEQEKTKQINQTLLIEKEKTKQKQAENKTKQIKMFVDAGIRGQELIDLIKAL